MNSILVDSSAWIEYFKTCKEFHFIDELIDNNTICTNDLILCELLPSIMHRKEKRLADLLASIPQIQIDVNWHEIRELQLHNLKQGINNVGIADLIIAQNCMCHDLWLVTQDKHFRLMADYLPLKLYKPN
jgi:predicted nucleic acid-binding protein